MEVDPPVPAPGEVLVRMLTAAVNPIDDVIRRGRFPGSKEPPLIPGGEGCGVVVSGGDPDWPQGARVLVRGGFGVTSDGTWREMVAASPESLYPVPDSLSDAQVAASGSGPFAGLLALEQGGFAPGQTVLVPAFGGAVGNAAWQIASALGAGRVITTAGTTAKAEAARALGAADVVDLSGESLPEAVGRLTGDAGVDLAVDSVGGSMTGQLVPCLATGGTIVVLGYVAGTRAEIDLQVLVRKRGRIVTASLVREPAQRQRRLWERLYPLLADGRLVPVVGRVFDLAEAAGAQRCLAEERPLGKVVLSISEGGGDG